MGAIDQLITELAKLPGIGRKTAQRLTYHLLQHSPERPAARRGASCVAEQVRPCEQCGNPTEGGRAPCLIPVVTPHCSAWWGASAVSVVERATGCGRTMSGRPASPLTGGTGGTALDRPVNLRAPPTKQMSSFGMEGEVTATYIQQLLSGLGPRVTRLARGLPMGGDLEYVDGVTLAHALSARQEVS